MYHLRRLLEMDSGAIHDASSSPPRAPPSQVQQAQEHAPPPEPLTPQLTINHYLHGFDDNNTEDDLLQSFNPGIVPPLPPEQILQPVRFQPTPLFEFEDMQLDQINLDEINLIVPDLLKALDDFAMPTSAEPNQNVQPLSQDNCHETPMANIGTVYAEPAATENDKEVSGAFSSIRNETKSSHNGSGQCNSFHISIRPNDIKWDLNNTEAKIEAVKTSPPPNRQFTWFKPGETSGHHSSYTGQIKITELPAGHLKDLTGPSGSGRNDERPFNILKFRHTETTPSSSSITFKATETKEESKVKEKFDFFKYAQAKRQEEQSNMYNFPRDSKDIDKNKEESPSRNRNEDNKSNGFFNFRQPAEPRTSGGFGSLGNPSSRWMDEVSDDVSTTQPFERSHSPLEIDAKATFLPIRADNKIEPFIPFGRNKQVQPLASRRSCRLSQTSPTSQTTTSYDFLVPAAESTPAAGRKRDQRPRSQRRKAPTDKREEGTPAKRSRKKPSGPSAKALKNKKMPNTE